MESERRLAGDELLLTAVELAERLEVSPRHLRNLVTRGEFPPPLRLGRSVRWLRSEVEEFLATACPRA